MRSSIGGTPEAQRSVQYNKYERRHATAKKWPRDFRPRSQKGGAFLVRCNGGSGSGRRKQTSYFGPSPIIEGSNSIMGCPAPHIFALRSQLSARSPSLTKS